MLKALSLGPGHLLRSLVLGGRIVASKLIHTLELLSELTENHKCLPSSREYDFTGLARGWDFGVFERPWAILMCRGVESDWCRRKRLVLSSRASTVT